MLDKQGPLPTSDEVLEALRRSGWLLEQDTHTALLDAGFYVTPGASFPDLDDETASREIDVLGWKSIHYDEGSRRAVGIRVLAECKQSTMPYVLVGRNARNRDRTDSRSEHTFREPSVVIGRDHAASGGTRLRTISPHRYLGLLDVPPFNDDFVATQMTRLDLRSGTWSAGNEGIFTSLIYPLAKASSHWDAQTRKVAGAVEFRFPVVVTSAPVFQVNVDDAEISPTVVRWATMARSITTASLKGTFRADVVTYSALSTYLSDRVGALERALAKVPLDRFFTSEDMTWESSQAQ